MIDLSFLQPTGLVALLGLPLVYLFHMRSPTPKSTEVPSLRFWRAHAPRPTDEPRFRRPPLTLDLILHLAIVALLGLALARPVTSAFAGSLGSGGEPVHHIILLDGSTSMLSTGDIAGRTRFQDAQAVANDRIASLRAGDAATVVLFGARVTTRSASDPAELRRLGDDIAAMTAPGGVADLTAVLLLAGDLQVPGIENRLLLLSDGALSADPAAVSRLGVAIEDVRFGPPSAPNLAILELSRRNDAGQTQGGQLLASIGNFGAMATTATLSLVTDGVPVAERLVTFAGDERRVEAFSLPNGSRTAEVRLSPGDSQTVDDVATIQLDGGGVGLLRVLIFSDSPDAVGRAFGALPGVELTMETTDAARSGMGTSGFDLVVYDQVIPASNPISPALFIAPPDSDLFRSPAMLAETAISTSDPGDPLLNGVDLTGVQLGPTPAYVVPDEFAVPIAANDGPLLAYGNAVTLGIPVVLLASPLTDGNLTERIAFPILIANMADWLAPTPPPAVLRVGDPLLIVPATGVTEVLVVAPDGSQVSLDAPPFEALDRSVVFSATGQAGVYAVEERDADGVVIGERRISVNAGSPTESDLRARPGLTDALSTASSPDVVTSASKQATELWPLLVALALLAAIAEWFHSVWSPRRTPRQTASVRP